MRQSPNDETDPFNPGITRTDADITSETRFGPRPVPKGHRRPAGPQDYRRIPPSGDVSPDGKRAYLGLGENTPIGAASPGASRVRAALEAARMLWL